MANSNRVRFIPGCIMKASMALCASSRQVRCTVFNPFITPCKAARHHRRRESSALHCRLVDGVQNDGIPPLP